MLVGLKERYLVDLRVVVKGWMRVGWKAVAKD
jgi:hypothetical protein